MATKKDKENQMNQANAAALKLQELERAGGVPMTGLSPTGSPQSTIGMSKSEKFFSEGRALDKYQREGYKTFGDKATGETVNKMRAAQGRPPISNTPKEFSDNINKSVGFGGKSALLDQAGRDRALKGGIGAGLSYEEADAEVQKAYDFLKKKYGGTDTPTTPTTPTTSTTPPPVPTPSATAPTSPALPPEVLVEKGPTMQFFSDVLSGEGAPRALVKGGSLTLKGMEESRKAKAAAEAAAEAAAAAAAKTAGAAGDVTKPFSMVDDVAKTASESLDVIKQKYSFAKPAGDITKSFGVVDDVARVAGAVGDTSEAARAAGDIAKDIADKASSTAYEGASAADETAAAAGKGKGVISRLVEGAANSRLGKLAAATARGGGKGLRIFGRAAGPALEIYDAGRYFMGDEEVKNQYAEDAATLGQRVFQPESFGEFAGGIGDVLSPTKNILGTAEAASQLLKAQRGARGAEASLKYAQSVVRAQDDRRKQLYPDEVFDELPRETKRKIRQAIRKEFSDAGIKTFGRYQ